MEHGRSMDAISIKREIIRGKGTTELFVEMLPSYLLRNGPFFPSFSFLFLGVVKKGGEGGGMYQD